MNFSDRVSVVLVEPQSPGNVGMVCRAMKNMGLNQLRLRRDDTGQVSGFELRNIFGEVDFTAKKTGSLPLEASPVE